MQKVGYLNSGPAERAVNRPTSSHSRTITLPWYSLARTHSSSIHAGRAEKDRQETKPARRRLAQTTRPHGTPRRLRQMRASYTCPAPMIAAAISAR
jgi:hypothetical protein